MARNYLSYNILQYLAVFGVGHEIWRLGTIAWETAFVALGYAAYFILRKKFKRTT
jgi:chloramphenicol-sensitive protein RarD